MQYIIQFKGEIDIEAESPEKAKEEASKKFDGIKEVRVSEAKVVDKNSGYFL
jgi:hypothetical protein